MKLIIEGDPEEIAKLAAEYARHTYVIIRSAETQMANLILFADAATNKDDKTTDTEVPSGGHFH